MGPMGPDKYQELLNERDEIDDVPVGLERYQAQKCAAIIMEGIAGSNANAKATTTIANYLQAQAWDVIRVSVPHRQPATGSGSSSMSCPGQHPDPRCHNQNDRTSLMTTMLE